jgi:DNA polymerase-1
VADARVVLIDGSGLVFRSFFALPQTLRTSGGLPTNASYGFATTFRKILSGRRPARGCVVFDAPGPTFRELTYPAYKAERPRMPSDLRAQLPFVERLCDAHGFPVLRIPGVEADDVIGTLARRAVERGDEVVIVSSDKDFAQLVGDRVKLYDPMRDVTQDAELIRKRWGVRPEQFVDYLAIHGDSVDNIPGVDGIGAKGAADLLEKFGDLDAIYARIDEVPTRARKALVEHRIEAFVSRDLARIRTDVELDVGDDTIAIRTVPDADRDDLFLELEFFSLLQDKGASEASRADVAVVDGTGATLLPDTLPTGPVAVAVAWDGPSAPRGALRGLALAAVGLPPVYVPAAHVGRIAAWLADPDRPKVTWDARDAETALVRAGYGLAGVVGDTGLASFLLDPAANMPHRHDQVTRVVLRRPSVATAPKAGRSDAELAAEFGGVASEIAESWPILAAALSERGADELIRKELVLSRVLCRMQVAGVAVRPDILRSLQVEFAARKDQIEVRLHELAGHPFNPGSPKQLATVLFEELQLPVVKKTKTGYSTDAEVLERLAPQHPIAAAILDWRALAKLIDTYTAVLLEAVDPLDGRVRATFTQTVGVSGRIIATEPDLQRTPIRTPDGRRIREAFVPRPGWTLISADWSQIELRLLAHFTRDPALVAAFRANADVHRQTASRIYGVPLDAVTREQRNVGKTVNFATIYGQGATALGQQIGVPRKEAVALIERYFTEYAGVKAWIDGAVAFAVDHGYCETLTGRRRYVPELSSRDVMTRSYGERIAANTPIQGSAADLCKIAMVRIDEALTREGLEARMLLQIHDELVFEAPPGEVATVETLVRRHMEQVWPLEVPLVVDVGHGASWAEAHGG